jgi:hypothetical protein
VDGFWDKPEDLNADLGERAFGTDAQLWERHDVKAKEAVRLAKLRQPPPGNGGGRGEPTSNQQPQADTKEIGPEQVWEAALHLLLMLPL